MSSQAGSHTGARGRALGQDSEAQASSGTTATGGAPGITVGGRRLQKEKASSQKGQALHMQVREAGTQAGGRGTHSSAPLSPPYSGIFPQFKQKIRRKERCESMAKTEMFIAFDSIEYLLS